MYVEDMAWFLGEVSQAPPKEGCTQLYIPCVEAPTVAEMCAAFARAYGKSYRAIRCPAIVWRILEWLTGRKRLWEKIFPHKLYNTVWQANILVGQGYWNESVKLSGIARSRRLTTFDEFTRMMADSFHKEKR